MDLNAATLTPNPTDIFSLIPLLGNNPVASTGLSSTPAQDFSAFGKFTRPHPLEQVEVFFHAAAAERAVLSRLGNRAAILAHFF